MTSRLSQASPFAVVTIIALYALFSFTASIAGLAGLIGTLLTFDASYLSRVWRGLDRLAAAVLGWDGNSTVSKECGSSDCRFCRIVCAILNVILEQDHCKKEAAGGA